MKHSPENHLSRLLPIIEKGGRRFRDSALLYLINYVNERAIAVEKDQPELSKLLRELAQATTEKQKLREALNDRPETADDLADIHNATIIKISKELSQRFPREYIMIEAKNQEFKNSN